MARLWTKLGELGNLSRTTGEDSMKRFITIAAMLLSASVTHAQSGALDKLPPGYLQLLNSCISSGGQGGFRQPFPAGGVATADLLQAPAPLSGAPIKLVTVNVWSTAPSILAVTLKFWGSDGKEQQRILTNNASFTTTTKGAWLHINSGDYTILWCSRIQ
jgi:hypothetical protein